MPSLESAIFAPFQIIMGQARRPGIYDRAAALLVHVAKAHAFHDGNKRTALHLAIFYLRLNGITVHPTPNAEAGDLTPIWWTPDIQPSRAGKKGNLPPCPGTPNSSNAMP
ncbi:type II toxin-antitoxin system death-on-curing family toxin [Corynebacterium accolens]|uniref:type II toxin-antitoxin system death-on-curing family toxin n=1 Tax=Corynebacterium accolens TaxID=38284 RepID=UPI00345E7A44